MVIKCTQNKNNSETLRLNRLSESQENSLSKALFTSILSSNLVLDFWDQTNINKNARNGCIKKVHKQRFFPQIICEKIKGSSSIIKSISTCKERRNVLGLLSFVLKSNAAESSFWCPVYHKVCYYNNIISVNRKWNLNQMFMPFDGSESFH